MQSWEYLQRSCTALTVLALLSVSLPSCTVLGSGVGAGIDSLIPGPYEVQPSADLVRLERGVIAMNNMRFDFSSAHQRCGLC